MCRGRSSDAGKVARVVSGARRLGALLMHAACLCLPLSGAVAAPEEIVVFTDEFTPPSEVGYELHLNWTRRGRMTPAYAGEQPPGRVLRLMPEVVWGLSPGWNLGLHLPMSRDTVRDITSVDGLKVRLQNLNVRESGAGSTWFYGANYEINLFHRRVSELPAQVEVRGIIGWRNEDWMAALNPVLSRGLNARAGADNHTDLDVFGKVMRTLGKDLSVGVEHYSSLGPLHRPEFGGRSGQITYGVVEFPLPGGFDVHLGVGHGWTASSDKRVFKMLLGLPL